MGTDLYINKRSILDRMLNHAAEYMGVGRSELLDPVITLFIESLGEEIYKLSSEVNHMETRILDKLSGMLISDCMTLALPAHGIIHAQPVEPEVEVSTLSAFYTTISHKNKPKKIAFYPVCDTHIHNVRLRYFIRDGQAFSINKHQSPTLLGRGKKSNSIPSNMLYLGLELDEHITNIAGFSFYHDFKGLNSDEKYLEQLILSKWMINDLPISMKRGLPEIKLQYQNPSHDFITSINPSNRINQIIKEKYDIHYLTMEDEFSVSDHKTLFPDELKSSFDQSFTDTFLQPLLWIKVTLPSSFAEEIIQNLRISLNCIPVVNKRLVRKIEEVSRKMPIIPLDTDKHESFISIHSIIDSAEKYYSEIPITHSSNQEDTCYGLYSLHRGGLERLGIREGRDYLGDSINLIEYAISSFFRKEEELKADLKQLQREASRIVKDLKQVINKEEDNLETRYYILIDQNVENEIYFIDYWITDYESGKYVRNGQTLQSDLLLNDSSAIILSHNDGKPAPSQTEKYDSYKSILTHNNLLVTNEDIERFCLKHFSESIQFVKIQEGYKPDPKMQYTFLKTKDIYLYPKPEQTNMLDNKEDNELYVQQLLSGNSPATFHYRVFINETI